MDVSQLTFIMKTRIIEIDGNDGVGKTFAISRLKDIFCDVEFRDRGRLTIATDTDDFTKEGGVMYVLLDGSVEWCQRNILKRGGSIEEKYHTAKDLTFYRQRFLKLAQDNLIPVIAMDDGDGLRKLIRLISEWLTERDKSEVLPMIKEKLGVDFKEMTIKEFRRLPLFVEGESKEIRLLAKDIGIIFFKPTIYSFTANRTGIVEGSNTIRVKVSEVLCELLKSYGVRHSYICYADEFVVTRVVRNPNIEVIVKANHTGTSKHRYFGMDRSAVRDSHPYFGGMKIKTMESYPHPIVRFDWRNPFRNPDNGSSLADEILCDEQADWYIDVAEAKKTARKTFAILQDFLNTKDIMIYDLCLFISEDGKTVYGEISPDCGRFRHYNLGSLDKDVWRAGGSSSDVLKKWELLYRMIIDDHMTI